MNDETNDKDWIDVTVVWNGLPLAADSHARYMAIQPHWAEVFPDARERWAWVYWLARCGFGPRDRLTTPWIGDGTARWRLECKEFPVHAGQVADYAVRLAGRTM